MKTGDDVGNEKASCVEVKTWPFPERRELSVKKREESQPIVVVVGGESTDTSDAHEDSSSSLT